MSLFSIGKVTAQAVINNSTDKPFIIGDKMFYLIDTSNNLSPEEVASLNLSPIDNKAPNFGLSHFTYWLKFQIKNASDNNKIFIEVRNPTLTNVSLYAIDKNKAVLLQHSGESIPISERAIKYRNPIFLVSLKKGETNTYLFKIKSKKILSLPIFIGNAESIFHMVKSENYIFYIFFGIMLIMFFYNFFIFLSVRDKDYLYYIFYIFTVYLAQASLKGHTYAFLWPDNVQLAEQSTNIFIALSGIASTLFIKKFLQVKKYYKSFNILFNLFIAIYLICILLNLSGYLIISQKIIQTNTFIGIIVALICGFLIQRKGNRSAIFFNLAWLSFWLSIIIYILKDAAVLPYNNFTSNAIEIGSAIEIALLSFALADKINIYRKEKEISNKIAIQAAREKEDYIRRENIILENRVKKRTSELQKTNDLLNDALNKLKNAQSKLIVAEKMSSLGQLTAGIAHEINNPINFVKSSIKPLKMDIQDLMELISKYEGLDERNLREKILEANEFKKKIDLEFIKKEIGQLFSGIDEGAERTANIVKGLRNFSRHEEQTLKEVSIPEAIDITLTLVKYMMPPKVAVIRHYNAYEPIECYPGKINQMLMNIITNAIQAITSEPDDKEDQLIIETKREGTEYLISIRDTGPGIPENIREKIFDPFFTTKDVGEGTGLGLSIVFSIVEAHKGRIEVYSEEGKGTEFSIFLPIKQAV